MQLEIIKITNGFYQLKQILSSQLLEKLNALFAQRDSWEKLMATDQNLNIRLQLGMLLNDSLSQEVAQELKPVVDFISNETGRTLYQNSPQLWYDSAGYQNQIHCDTSPNLSINVQVYLGHSQQQEIGTHCFQDDTWYAVPYKFNEGYVMVDPTKRLHGMRYPVQDNRKSLYQSFRDMPEASDIW